MTGQSIRVGVASLLVLAACVCCVSGHSNERSADDEITSERMQIFVKFENGTTFSMMVEPDDVVENLWYDIYTNQGVPWNRISLKIGDTSLSYGQKLSDHNIRAGATLTLCTPEEHARRITNFIVKTRDGRELPVATLLGNTVASLKDNITQWTGIPQVEQRLLVKGKELKDERTLVQYEFHTGAIVELARPLEECLKVVTIFVKTMSGASMEIEIDLADTANTLKDKIQEKVGVPAGVQRLMVDERVITGQDHLCDLGLVADSTVHMVLYSSRITSLDQVARLKEVDPAHRAPIFREADDSAKRPSRPVSLYKDARNWVTEIKLTCDAGTFDPVVRFEPNPDDEESMQREYEKLERFSRSDASESERLKAVLVRPRIKLISAVRPYRVTANLSSVANRKQQPGFTLGGGSIEVSPQHPVPLGADINNWAPDAFSDADLMRLFEVSERVRQVLASDAKTGKGTLSIGGQRRINEAILMSYLEALAGCSPLVKYNQAREGEQCGVCWDDLTAEPAVKLACEHTFHADCIQTWEFSLHQALRFPSCPFCRHPFMIPYAVQGELELESPEFNLD